MQDRPTSFPTTQPNGEPLKPLTRVMLERRATAHFTDEEVPEEYLNAILALGCQSPSGCAVGKFVGLSCIADPP